MVMATLKVVQHLRNTVEIGWQRSIGSPFLYESIIIRPANRQIEAVKE